MTTSPRVLVTALEALSEALEGEVRPFGICVAIVEPGRVATPIKGKIVTPAGHDTSSPYRARHQRVTARLAETLWAGGWAETPESVAASIWEAVTTETPRLRWVVGRDAPLVAELRGREAVDAFRERLASALEAMRPPSNGA